MCCKEKICSFQSVSPGPDTQLTTPYSVVWVLEPLLDCLIIPGIRMHINCVCGVGGGTLYMQLDS